MDGKSEIEMLSFEATKVRLLRSLCIESQTMQVSCCNMSLFLPYIVSYRRAHSGSIWFNNFVLFYLLLLYYWCNDVNHLVLHHCYIFKMYVSCILK